MSRSIEIDSVERADLTRLESFSFQESAYRGEVGQGGFDIDSEALAVDVPAWKDVEAVDSDGGRIFTGHTIDRGLGRGPYTTDADAQWDVQCVDINTILDDPLIRGIDSQRPAETDVARVQWLYAWIVSRGYAIGDDYLSTADPETMDAYDYRGAGQFPRGVLDSCAEQTNKSFYVFYDEGVTDQLQLWYGKVADNTRVSDHRISSVLSDIDDYGETWAAEWPEEAGLQRDPSRVYSGVQVMYGDGSKVFVDRPATETAFKLRETQIFDDSVTTAAAAERLGEYYLDNAETEDDTVTVAVTLPTVAVNYFQHGQNIDVRFPHLGYADFTTLYCVKRTIEPAGESENRTPRLYHVILVLKPAVKVTRSGGGGRGGDIPEVPTGDTPAELTLGACVSVVNKALVRQNNGTGETQSLGAAGSADDVGSWVGFNTPYTDGDFPCPLGGGSWSGYHDEEIWLQFTAPADNPALYLGMQTILDLSTLDTDGRVFGYVVRITQGAAAIGRWGEGITIAPGPTASGTTATIYIPRSFIDWGGINCLVLHPDWLCERPVQFCNTMGSFNNPHADGRGNSGSYDSFGFDDVCVVKFADGIVGEAQGVAGVGDVDGTNAEFTLIAWDGTGGVTATINGLEVGAASITLDTAAKTVTFNTPPAFGSVVLFRYRAVT